MTLLPHSDSDRKENPTSEPRAVAEVHGCSTQQVSDAECMTAAQLWETLQGVVKQDRVVRGMLHLVADALLEAVERLEELLPLESLDDAESEVQEALSWFQSQPSFEASRIVRLACRMALAD